MKRKFLLSALCLLMSACGGGGGGTTATTTTVTTTPVVTVSKEITGTASEGAALTGKAYLKDAKGAEVNADIAADGKFKFVVDNMTAPFILKAGTLYSFTQTHGSANINPFTDLATKIASNITDLATVYSSDAGTLATQLQTIQSKIQTTVSDLNSKIDQVYQKYGITTADQKNFMTGTITIGQGVDAMFDTFKVTVASDGSIAMKAKSDGATIFTATSSSSGIMNITSQYFSTNLPPALVGSSTATPATYSIAGNVTLNGAGLSGVMVSLTGGANATTASDGSYTFTSVKSGTYTVTPALTGYTFTPTSTSVTVSSANVTGNNFTVTNTGSITVGW